MRSSLLICRLWALRSAWLIIDAWKSRIHDPIARQIVWEYHAAKKGDFYSPTRGAAQRLANGNTLITESGRGRLFEVTPTGDIVWEYFNPNRSEDGLPLVVVRARRVSAEGLAERRFERSD